MHTFTAITFTLQAIVRKVIFLHPIKQKLENMSMSNAYFYGYYFYFASNCEAVCRK